MTAALSVLHAFSDEYGLNWDADSMLAIAVAYIDNQQDTPAFMDFVTRQAEDEIRATDDDNDEDDEEEEDDAYDDERDSARENFPDPCDQDYYNTDLTNEQ